MRQNNSTNSIANEAILTKDNQETDEDGRQRAHAKLQRLTFLNQLAVLAPETVRTNATVSESRILVDTSAAVQAGIVDALVLVHAALVVRRWNPPFPAAAVETSSRIDYFEAAERNAIKDDTHVQSYSFQRSMHSKGSWQITLAHGLFDGQFLSRFRAIVA
jgi:hypothetical protein